ncbi:hypothetical protein DL766_005767 [Monosporascus sp. MC13-8B]|nr:hypothetical protein DL763_006418 [Monosporascus cannonballus]RYP28614.1 hypothetical protein DL766_005767 [Monosporascus sp. MC13-8B]
MRIGSCPVLYQHASAVRHIGDDSILVQQSPRFPLAATSIDCFIGSEVPSTRQVLDLDRDASALGPGIGPLNKAAKAGLSSWDGVFVRRFRDVDALRPVAYPSGLKRIVNSCESKPFALQTNLQEEDTLCLKASPYSVAEMLNQHEEANRFIGGTVYQGLPKR